MKPKYCLIWIFLSVCMYGTFLPKSVLADYSIDTLKKSVSVKERRIYEVLSQEIIQKKLIVKRFKKKETLPKHLLHYANLYAEKARTIRRWEYKYFEKQTRDKQTSRKRVDDGLSRKSLANAIKIAVSAAKRFPKHKMSADIYFFLGVQYREFGSEEKSNHWLDKFQQIVDESHPLYPDVLSILGVAEFKKRNFNKAIAHLERSIRLTKTQAKPSQHYPKTIYYLGLVKMNVAKYSQAHSLFEQVIRMGDGKRKYISFKYNAIGTLPESFAKSGKHAPSAGKYFSRLAGTEKIDQFLKRLSSIYEKTGKISDYLSLQAQRYKYTKDNNTKLEIMIENSEFYNKTGKITTRTDELVFAASRFGPKGKYSKGIIEDLQTTLMKKIRIAAGTYHKQAQNLQDPKDRKIYLKAASRLYPLYLKHWPKTDDHFEVRSYLGDILFLQENFMESAKQYGTLAKNAKAPANIRKDSAERQLSILNTAYERAKNDLQRKNIDLITIRAIDDFTKVLPNDKRIPDLLLRVAALEMKHKGTVTGVNRYLSIAQRFDGEEVSKKAVGAALSVLEREKLWKVAYTITGKVLKLKVSQDDDKFRSKVEKVRFSAEFMVYMDYEKDKKWALAAKGFESMSDRSPDKEFEFKTLNNAAANYKRSNDYPSLERIQLKLVKRFPRKPNINDIWLELASTRFFQARFDDSADAYWRFTLGANKKDNRVIGALFNAFLVWDAIQVFEKRDRVFEVLMKDHPRGIETEDAIFRMSDYYFSSNNMQSQKEILESYLRNFKNGAFRLKAHVRLAKFHNYFADPRKANYHLRQTISEYKKDSRHTAEEIDLVAEAAFNQLKEPLEKLKTIKLELPVPTLTKGIEKKLAHLDKLTKMHFEVVNYGSADWTLVSFQNLYRIYRLFANEMRNAPVPPALNDAEKAEYVKNFQSQGDRVRQKAIEFLIEGQKIALSKGIPSKKYDAIAYNLWLEEPEKFPLLQTSSWGGARPALIDPVLFD